MVEEYYMDTAAIIALALATVLAAGTALWIALVTLHRQCQTQRRKASIFRAQLTAQLHAVRQAIAPRGRQLDLLQKEIYEPLQYLWMQADVLEPEEVHAANECIAALLALRHKPSLNQTQARVACTLIDETCSLLLGVEKRVRAQQAAPALLPGLTKQFPYPAAIRRDQEVPPRQPHMPTEAGI